MADSGTVDITNLVNAMQSTFTTWGTNTVFAGLIAVPGLSFLGLPIISSILKAGITWALNYLSNDAILYTFFFNTAIKNASNAADYLTAVNAKNSLPDTATDAEYLEAEQNEMASFKSLVVIGS